MDIRSRALTDYEFETQEEFLPDGNAAFAESRPECGFPQKQFFLSVTAAFFGGLPEKAKPTDP